MKTVFADSHYWIATVKPGDPWAEAATAATSELGEIFVVTTDEVLTEFLAALSKRRAYAKASSANGPHYP